MAVGGGARQKVNWRRIIFYLMEGAYAFIAGTGEAYMYAAYNPPGTLRWYEAIARAVITQFAIVFFGVAGIEAAHWKGKAWVRWAGTLGSWTGTFVGCLITFWLLLDASRVFRDSAMLGPLNGATIPLPNGATIPNETVDILIVAAVPFFQLGLNMLAALITADHAPESAEDRQARQQAEYDAALHAQRMAPLKGAAFGGVLGGLARSAVVAAKGAQSTSDSVHDQSGDSVHDQPTNSVTNRDANSGTNTTAKARGVRNKKSGGAADLIEDAKTRYGLEIGEPVARKAMYALAGGQLTGRSYIAPMKDIRRWVDDFAKAQQRATNSDNDHAVNE